MSLFMNNRLIVSKQYHKAFRTLKILHCINTFQSFADYSSSIVAGGLPVQS